MVIIFLAKTSYIENHKAEGSDLESKIKKLCPLIEIILAQPSIKSVVKWLCTHFTPKDIVILASRCDIKGKNK
jgi:hypothetical protein